MGNITPGTTILNGIREAVSTSTQVIHSHDGNGASNADVVIVVVGEEPYAEGHGDRDDLTLSSEDIAVLNRVNASGKPMVVILLSGRPMIITDILDDAEAFMAAWLPGTEGNGISDVIFGDYNPTGKLSVSWPTDMSQIPINLGDSDYSPLFPVGFGLSY
jgi:beta-glucosidase